MAPLIKTLVLVFFFFLCSDSLAQESGREDVEPQERVVSFVEFVGFLERAEDVWVTPFDLEIGFYLEKTDEGVGREESQSDSLKPLEP